MYQNIENILNTEMMIRRITALLLLAITVSFAASAQIFYKIEGNGLNAPSYLFGTHHLAPTSVLESYPTLKEAEENASAVVGEIDMTIPQMQLAMAMQKYMAAPADSTLQALLSPEEFAALNEKFKPYSPMAGVDLNQLGAMRPMVLSTMVTMAEIQKSLPGFNPADQLDTRFQTEFKDAGKEIIPLETPEMQAELLYTFIPIRKQIEDFKDVLENPEELTQNCERLNKAYIAGDLDELLKLTESEDSDPAFMEALTTKRNNAWLQKLPDIMAGRPSLIVVGALHLAGDNGLVAGLRKAGYTVTPVK